MIGAWIRIFTLNTRLIGLVGAGLETFAPLDPAHPAYGQLSIQASYSHSLVGAALIALFAGLLAGRAWGRQAGAVIGGVVFSHWILDLVVHRPDLPILPGNAGNLPLLGFGLWQLPAVSAAIELALAVGGAALYYRGSRRAVLSSGKPGHQHTMLSVITGLTSLFIVLLLAADLLNLPISIALLLMLLLIFLCGWLDARMQRSLAVTPAGSTTG